METKKVFLVIADISGYTKFLQQKKISMVHAEKIVCELLESVIDATDSTLTFYEHSGDAVTFYAESDGSKETAHKIFGQVKEMFKAFKSRQKSIAEELSLNWKHISNQVMQLRLKTIIHHGDVIFTKIKNIIKVAGKEVILAHKLLKNSLKTNQYILTTEQYQLIAGKLDGSSPQRISEYYEGIGRVKAAVYNSVSGIFHNSTNRQSLLQRLIKIAYIDLYYFKKSLWRFVENYGAIERLVWWF